MARFLENSSKNLILGLDIYLQVCTVSPPRAAMVPAPLLAGLFP
jgi:hypothetical protein